MNEISKLYFFVIDDTIKSIFKLLAIKLKQYLFNNVFVDILIHKLN